MPRHQALQVLEQELQENKSEALTTLGAVNANICPAACGVPRF